MSLGSIASRTSVLRLPLLIALFAGTLFSSPAPAKPAPDDIPAASRMQPEELARAIKAGGAQKPVILYVGPQMFYIQAHIPGAEFIGQTGKPEGMEKLRARAASLAKDAPIVIYCGCCPWDHCPNIRPAFAELKKAGFTRVRVLYLATSFGADWPTNKGFPIATGE
ncbi:MAG: rhodanese-like domain-containing protein [Candidatus Angelobacter sp.]